MANTKSHNADDVAVVTDLRNLTPGDRVKIDSGSWSVSGVVRRSLDPPGLMLDHDDPEIEGTVKWDLREDMKLTWSATGTVATDRVHPDWRADEVVVINLGASE